ncbi:MAG: hypothetical protein EBR82_17235 [Caulobacteraceae bacterium]|nr:hypothetical protein [Caulobacteraceae bacterium]
MANRLQGEAEFAFEGDIIAICINSNVLLKAEDEIGVGLESLVGGLDRIGWLATLFRHAMHEAVDEAPGKLVSRKDAADILMLCDDARDALMRAFNNAMPKVDGPKVDGPKVDSDPSAEGKAQPQTPGIGMPSLSTGAKPAGSRQTSGSKPRARSSR